MRRSTVAVALLAVLLGPLLARASESPVNAGVGVEAILAQMTLEQKVGQLFISRVYGDSATEADPGPVAANRRQLGVDNAAQLIERYHVGGVIYFAWAGNVDSPRKAARLSNGIQRAALAEQPAVPVLISTDQEGGAVTRLKSPATQFAGSMALGATRRADLARRTARAIGRELRAVGIAQVLAPVADVNVNPHNPVIGLRSFGSTAELVSTMTVAQVDGFQVDAGAAATVKHFPGHGDTDVDSHSGLPVINHSRAEWEAVDAPPFRASIASGAAAIMTAHISVPGLDPSGTPATLSRPILTDLLRTAIGFEGVVVTDSLGMGALRRTYDDRRIPVLALKAGADMLLNPPRIAVAYDAVMSAIRDGELSEARVDQSVRRILALKERLGLFEAPLVALDAVGSIVGASGHRRVEREVADASITLLENVNEMLPLRASGSVLVTGAASAGVTTVASAIRRRGVGAEALATGNSPADALIDRAADRAAVHDLVVVLTANADTNERQRLLVRALVASGTTVVTVAVGRPYDAAYYVTDAHLLTYSSSDASMRALVRVLYGEREPVGRLPVTIPVKGSTNEVLYPFGFGLTYD